MFVCVAVCSIYTLNRHRRHSCYKDKRRQVGDGDCCKAVMAVIVLKTRTAFICSPSSQRRERKRERGGGELKRERAHRLPAARVQHLNDYTHSSLSPPSLSVVLPFSPPPPTHALPSCPQAINISMSHTWP